MTPTDPYDGFFPSRTNDPVVGLPTVDGADPEHTIDLSDIDKYACNMTLRAWLAGQALAGAMANPQYGGQTTWANIGEDCIDAADAVIAALKEARP